MPTIPIRCLSVPAAAYASFGKTAIGNSRWRCNVCGKTFSQNTKATARQREHYKNKTIFKLLVNKMPVRRIIEVADIHPKTFYHRLDFLHRQCQAFAAHRERALANSPSAGCTSASTDRTT